MDSTQTDWEGMARCRLIPGIPTARLEPILKRLKSLAVPRDATSLQRASSPHPATEQVKPAM